jgi:hypothetical protein
MKYAVEIYSGAKFHKDMVWHSKVDKANSQETQTA